jgi:hypothetical protein
MPPGVTNSMWLFLDAIHIGIVPWGTVRKAELQHNVYGVQCARIAHGILSFYDTVSDSSMYLREPSESYEGAVQTC